MEVCDELLIVFFPKLGSFHTALVFMRRFEAHDDDQLMKVPLLSAPLGSAAYWSSLVV
jgi:hypothetical protein